MTIYWEWELQKPQGNHRILPSHYHEECVAALIGLQENGAVSWNGIDFHLICPVYLLDWNWLLADTHRNCDTGEIINFRCHKILHRRWLQKVIYNPLPPIVNGHSLNKYSWTVLESIESWEDNALKYMYLSESLLCHVKGILTKTMCTSLGWRITVEIVYINRNSKVGGNISVG